MPKLVSKSGSNQSVPDKDLLRLAYDWELIHDTSVPVLFREEKRYIPVRVVEIFLLSRFPTQLPEELTKCWRCQSYYITYEEVALLNHINRSSCKPYGKASFTTNDIVIELSVFRPLYELVVDTVLSNRARQLGYTSGGWLQINNTVCPYTYRNDVRYIPSEVIEYCSDFDLSSITQHDVTEQEISALNELCRAAQRDFRFILFTTKLISMVDLILEQYPVVFELPDDDPIGSALPLNPDIAPDEVRRLRCESGTKFNVYMNKKYLHNTITVTDSTHTDQAALDFEAEPDLPPTVLDEITSDLPSYEHLPDLPKYQEKPSNQTDLPAEKDDDFLPPSNYSGGDSELSGDSDVAASELKERNEDKKRRKPELIDSVAKKKMAYEIERQKLMSRTLAPKPGQPAPQNNQYAALTGVEKSASRTSQTGGRNRQLKTANWPSYYIMENPKYIKEIMMPNATHQLDLNVLRYRYHPPILDPVLIKKYGCTKPLSTAFRNDIMNTDVSLQHVVSALHNTATVEIAALQLISRLIKMKSRILHIFTTARQRASKELLMFTVGSEESKHYKEAVAVLADASTSFSFWNATAHRISVGAAIIVNKMILKTILDRTYALSFHRMPDILHFMVAGILGTRDTSATNNFWFLQEIMSLAIVASNAANTSPAVAYGLMCGRLSIYLKTFKNWFTAILGFNGKQFLNNQFSELAAKMYTMVYGDNKSFGPSIRMHYLDNLINGPERPVPPLPAAQTVNPLQTQPQIHGVTLMSTAMTTQPVQTTARTSSISQFIANHPVLNTLNNMVDNRPHSRQSGTTSPESHNSNSSIQMLPSLPKKLPLDNPDPKIQHPVCHVQPLTKPPGEEKEIKSEPCKAFRFKAKKFPSCKKGEEVWVLLEDIVSSLFSSHTLQKVIEVIGRLQSGIVSRAPEDVILSFKDYNDMTPEEEFESVMAMTTKNLIEHYELISKHINDADRKTSEKGPEASGSSVDGSVTQRDEQSKTSKSQTEQPEPMEVDNAVCSGADDKSDAKRGVDKSDSAEQSSEAKEWKTYGKAGKSKGNDN